MAKVVPLASAKAFLDALAKSGLLSEENLAKVRTSQAEDGDPKIIARDLVRDSNLTKWPWYSNVAPISWLVQHDVNEGRGKFNLSTGEAEVEEMIESIRSGSMPPWQYKPLHAAARLSDQEKQDLIRGLEATFGGGRG